MTTPSAICNTASVRTTQDQRTSGDRRDNSHSVNNDRANQDDERQIAVQIIEPADSAKRQVARHAAHRARHRRAP